MPVLLAACIVTPIIMSPSVLVSNGTYKVKIIIIIRSV